MCVYIYTFHIYIYSIIHHHPQKIAGNAFGIPLLAQGRAPPRGWENHPDLYTVDVPARHDESG